MRQCLKRLIALTVFFSFCPALIMAAEISLPRMEMASRAGTNNGEFAVSSYLAADLALTGGHKYGFLLGFSLEAANFFVNTTGNLSNHVVPRFRFAQATARDIFRLPLDFSYFLGQGDDFCTGDEFSEWQGVSPFGTDFRGFFFFPDMVNRGRHYNGIHGVRGTGFSLTLTAWENVKPILYIYQNFPHDPQSLFPTGDIDPETIFGGGGRFFSGDLRVLMFFDRLRLEIFGGLSLTPDLNRSLRGGLMMHLASGTGAEFFAQAGIPSWQENESLNIDNFFFLIEPRLRLERFGVDITFFYHPVTYHHVTKIEERGRAAINTRLMIGNIKNGFVWGIGTGCSLKIDGMEDLSVSVFPFVSWIARGIRWDTKLNVNPLRSGGAGEKLELFFGVRTAF